MRISLSEIFVDERDQARAFYTPVLGSQFLIWVHPETERVRPGHAHRRGTPPA